MSAVIILPKAVVGSGSTIFSAILGNELRSVMPLTCLLILALLGFTGSGHRGQVPSSRHYTHAKAQRVTLQYTPPRRGVPHRNIGINWALPPYWAVLRSDGSTAVNHSSSGRTCNAKDAQARDACGR